MTELDDLFRDGLGDRRADVPQNLWNQINARRAAVPDGEELDRLFAAKLAPRQAPVPAAMWDRILAARRSVPLRRYAALLLLLLVFGAGGIFWARAQDESIVPTEIAPPKVRPEPTAAPAVATVPPAAVEASPSVASVAPDRPVVPAPVAASAVPVIATARRTASATRGLDLPSPAYVTSLGTAPTLSERAGLVSPGPAPFRRALGERLRGEVLLGAAYAHQRFGLNAESNRDLRNAREVSEFPQLSYQVTARIQYLWRPRMRILAGLTYLDIRNQLEYEKTVGGRKDLLRSSNHLRLLEVPVLGSYVVSGKRLRLSVNAGPVLNVLTAVDGRYLDPDFAEPQPLDGSAGYRSNVGLGWTLSLTTTYPLGKRGNTLLLLEPFFKTYPRSFTTANAPLREKYWLAGLQLGLRKSL